MSKIVWLPEALEDTKRLRFFLEDKSPSSAKKAAQLLQDGEKRIANFPDIGRPMNDDTNRRELFLPFGNGGYVLRYIVENQPIYGQVIFIVRAWHSKENRH